MQFRTEVPVSKSPFPIDYDSEVISLGSCFAVNMAAKLEYFRFRHLANPFGILFHPLALEKMIGLALDSGIFSEKDIFFHNERWHCFDAHSDLSHPDPEVLLSNLNSALQTTASHLAKASHLILTLGTAWVYRSVETNLMVANCHKVPQKQFRKELLTVGSVKQSLENMIARLQKANPKLQLILTVSPVRHTKDGFAENQWSKANLISAVQQVVSGTPAAYFPSYEIMMDELRDYRFYAEDMLHPNTTAIDYIWERFAQSWMADTAKPVMEEVDGIQKALAHRSFNPDSAQHQAFLAKTAARIAALQVRYPHITF